VNVSYPAEDDQRDVSFSDPANVSSDLKKVEELWNPLFKAWFPKVLDDPDICFDCEYLYIDTREIDGRGNH
jgi:general stress protein 26